jgi:hypothetical protein
MFKNLRFLVIANKSRGTSKGTGGGGPSSSVSDSISTSETQRAFLLPQEVMRLGNDRFLMFAEGVPHVIVGFRHPYYLTPEFAALYDDDPYHKKESQPAEAREPFSHGELAIPGFTTLDPKAEPIPFDVADWQFLWECGGTYLLATLRHKKTGSMVVIWNRATSFLVDDLDLKGEAFENLTGHMAPLALDDGLKEKLATLDPYFDVCAEPHLRIYNGWPGLIHERWSALKFQLRQAFGIRPTMRDLCQMALLVHNQVVEALKRRPQEPRAKQPG